ncbi:hypothetical protein [Acidithiobacillus sp.]
MRHRFAVAHLFMPRVIQRLSQQEDAKLRMLVKAAMAVIEKRNVDISRALQFSSGGISGWMNGGIDRLSTEKKNQLSDYLGICNGTLAPGYYHIWRSTADSLANNIPLLLPTQAGVAFHRILEDHKPFGVLMESRELDITVIILTKYRGAEPFSIIPDIFLDKIQKNVYVNHASAEVIKNADLRLNRDAIVFRELPAAEGTAAGKAKPPDVGYSMISMNSEKEAKLEVEAWFHLIIEAIDIGMSVDEARFRLGL